MNKDQGVFVRAATVNNDPLCKPGSGCGLEMDVSFACASKCRAPRHHRRSVPFKPPSLCLDLPSTPSFQAVTAFPAIPD